jgi:hypothetical protein
MNNRHLLRLLEACSNMWLTNGQDVEYNIGNQ